MVVECAMGETNEIRVPDVPLASLEDDIDSTKSHPSAATSDCENNVGDTNIDDDFNGEDNMSGSLEDLVGTFDQKITQIFKDMGETTEEMAPVQVRTQDEIMAESKIWWTLTGNLGNMTPLDYAKTEARQLQIPALNLNPRKEGSDAGVDVSDDEELRGALDMHQLICQHGPLSESPPQTADQVIEEIDQMLQSCDFTASTMTDRTMESVDSMYSSMRSAPQSLQSDMDDKFRQAVAITANPDYLQSLPYSKLVTLNAEMEQLIQVYNESLVEQLAHRDELEYEKEMKNTFISLLLSIQNRRRQFTNERKRRSLKFDMCQLPQYMTATIPYDESQLRLDSVTLQSLIKLLKAIDDDNPHVPSMLTDYILTVVCPSSPSPVLSREIVS